MKTVKVHTTQLIPGMIVGHDVYSLSNQLIIPKGTELTDNIITRINFYSIPTIIIEANNNEVNTPIESFINKSTYKDQIQETIEFKQFKSEIQSITSELQKGLNDVVSGKKILDEEALVDQLSQIISYGRNGSHIFDMMHCIRDYDDSTYMHSVNVAIISYTLGSWLNFTRKDLETLTLCGLFHDIGKITIPDTIMNKPSKLTKEEYETIKTHTLNGYNILKSSDTNIHIKMSTMMHHERCDGSGYPMGLKGTQIDKFAKIVMIADVYDAMTSSRIYRGPLSPFEAIGFFESEGLTKFEPKFIMTFLDHIYEIYQNSPVRLNDKREGTIVMIDRNNISKPLVKIGTEYIDLLKNPNLSIEAFL